MAAVGSPSVSERSSTEPPVFECGDVRASVDFDQFLLSLWKDAMTGTQLFRYSLTDVKTRLIPGEYKFLLQRNPKRITHRRRPADIHSLQQPFDPEGFNFNKINPAEILFKIKRTVDHKVEYHNVIINVSPINHGHCLFVPSPELCLPQVLTCNSLEICLELVSMSQRKGFCVIANSLLAYASVNHLHYHFLYIEEDVLFNRLKGIPVVKGICYELVNHPLSGFGFVLTSSPKQCARNVFKVVELLIRHDIPHNIVIMRGKHFTEEREVVRVVVFPKQPAKGAKNLIDDNDQGLPAFVVAAMEVIGFVVVVDQDKFYVLSEADILQEFTKMTVSSEKFQELKEDLVKFYPQTPSGVAFE